VGERSVGADPPRADPVQGALFVGQSLLRRGDYFHAHRAFVRAASAAEGADRELARGLAHLAAAGYKRAAGDAGGTQRQLGHARRRLAPFLPVARRLDLAALIAAVDTPVDEHQ
jgi:hypothetical protein